MEDVLTQFNIRVKKSVAQAYRSFCKERGLTQSEGLRLLLLGEDFTERDLMMQIYQKEIAEKNMEIADLKEQNKELLALQRDKESRALQQRKEWVKVAKVMLGFVFDRIDKPKYDSWETMKPFSMKSEEGRELFFDCQYPPESGGYEVSIIGLVWGLGRENNNPDESTPIFVCGELKDETSVKFRWYPKKHFLGVPPYIGAPARWGDSWLLCCVTAKDGAADLIGALPLRGLDKLELFTPIKDKVIPASKPEGRKPSLSSMIISADKRRTVK